jgi:hypothetical protein
MSADTPSNAVSESSRVPPFKPEILEKLLDIQLKEQARKGEEIQLRDKESERNAKYADDVLQAQVRDREHEREHDRRMTKNKFIFAGLCLVAVLIFIGVALAMNKDAFVLEALKLSAAFFAGGAGGYGIGRSGKKGKEDFPE